MASAQGIPEIHVREHFQRFHETMLAADLCTAATEALAHEGVFLNLCVR
jgi:hypothetical protein